MSAVEPPKAVKMIAEEEGCNDIRYVGKVAGRTVFGIGQIDENGIPLPTGLPTLVLWDGSNVEMVTGEDALKLHADI